MLQYLIKRLLLLVVSLFGITLITFVVTRLTPGDPSALKAQGAGAAGRSVGGYDELVERNRRNLGLDKPLLVNLRFDDRESLAHRAIDDLFRASDYWRKDAEKRLARISTIALKPALDRYELIGTPEEPRVLQSTGKEASIVPAERRRELLAAILPRLANETVQTLVAMSPDETHAYWKNWYEQNRSRYEDEALRVLVEEYVSADAARAAELQPEVQKAGGFATPHLLKHLDSRNVERLRRLNAALESQTGFTFVTSDEELTRDPGALVERWQSWWRRDSSLYQQPSAFQKAFNVIFDTQFGLWMKQAITFDFGESYIKKRPVSAMIGEAFPVSLLLSGLSIFFSYLIAIPLGIFSAMRRHTRADATITVILFILYSLPSFWVAGMLILTTTGPPFLNIFPTRGLGSPELALADNWSNAIPWLLDRVWHLVLPVTCLTYGSLAFISRQMRGALLETITQDYIRTAQAKGLPWRTVVLRHALRNSLIPVLTISAGLLPELIAGAVIIESIFTIPGMGTLTFEAILNRDYPVVNAVLFFSAFLTLLGILLADLSYAIADPRISYV